MHRMQCMECNAFNAMHEIQYWSTYGSDFDMQPYFKPTRGNMEDDLNFV